MVKVYQIETTNICNYTCHFCPQHQEWYSREEGFMELSLIDRVDWSETEFTEVQMTGEPTLHPKLKEIIDLLHKKGVKVGFSSNASKETMANLAKVVDDVDILTVNKDMYREPAFLHKRNVHLQQLGIDFNFEDYSRRQVRSDKIPHCTTPFNYISIQWNGDVVPCCKDHGGMHVFGNLHDQSWDEVINGKKRANFLKNMKNELKNGLCEYCDFPNPHRIHDNLIEEYL